MGIFKAWLRGWSCFVPIPLTLFSLSNIIAISFSDVTYLDGWLQYCIVTNEKHVQSV